MPTLYLIDAPNILFRAFHAIRDLKNSRGMPTNAVFGFANMLNKLMRDQKPDAIAAVWDTKEKTFRDEMFSDYKGTRSEMPDDLAPQIPQVKQMLDGYRVRCLEQHGVEADDIIATLAKQATKKGWNTVIVSGDKDLMQLVDGNVSLLDTMKDVLYDREAVIAKWGVPPEKLGDVLALMGDSVDNIPGVAGVGEKTAVKLITEYGSLKNLLASTASIKGKLREKLETGADMARLSRELVELKIDCDVDIQVEDLKVEEPDKSFLGPFFDKMEFRRLAAEFEAPERRQEETPLSITKVASLAELEQVVNGIKSGHRWLMEIVAPDGDVLQVEPAGFVLQGEQDDAFIFVPVKTADSTLPEADVVRLLAGLIHREDVRLFSSDAKRLLLYLARHGEKSLPEIDDLGLMSYVYNPAGEHHLDACVLRILQLRLPLWDEVCGKGKTKKAVTECPADEVANMACRRAKAALDCVPQIEEQLRAEKMAELYETIERPLVPVLAAMEAAGIRVDRDRLAELSEELGTRMDEVQKEIFEIAGGEFNIQSPKQLNEIMFERLEYATKGIKKTKTGQYSTDSDVLEKLAADYPLPRLILQYRTVAKLKGTYVDALPPLIHADGRIHTSFNQLVAATGRLSSVNPNLQNIPIRDEAGRKIREAFVPAEGNVLISCDYSQIELRILAHIADDAILQESFSRNEDVHRRTAAEVFEVDPADVDAEMRRKAKAVNFGIAYGQTSYGLSTALGIGGSEAQVIIDRYFERYKGVRKYLDDTIALAREQEYVTTLFGRRRLLPDIHHKNMQVRQFAERTAINTPIQGTAADLIKVAMIRIHRLLAERNAKSRMILQVHDELIFDMAPEEKGEFLPQIKQLMEGVLDLKVPLVVEVGEGKSWAEAH